MRRLWLDPGFGASGDMMLGALVGLGASIEQVRTDLAGLNVDGWSIETSTVTRGGISATRTEVSTADEPHPHRAWSTIDRLLADSALPESVAAGARATFRRLGQAEAAIHDIPLDDVHFHEVGAVDAIVDIVGSWSALGQLSIDEVIGGPIGLGRGTVEAAHGTLPVPAPATLDLLTGTTVQPVEWSSETVTPTGAALLVTMVDRWGPIPSGALLTSSRGAGGRNPSSHPNVLSAMILEASKSMTDTDGPGGSAAAGAVATTGAVLATNLDDVTPEIIGHTIARLLEAGADDAWVTPVTMKKNRPGHELRVLCATPLTDTLRTIIFAETGTLGIRTETVTKHALDRSFRTVLVRDQPVRMKVGPHGAKPEHDDLVALSERTGAPIRRLADEARAADSSFSP